MKGNTSRLPKQSRDTEWQKNQFVPRTRRKQRQEIETLINEEAFLFAQYLRNKRQTWNPRIVGLT